MTEEDAASEHSEVVNVNASQKNGKEGEAGMLGLLIALVYGTGIAATNVYLSTTYGIRDFSLVKPKAVFSGATVLFTIALFAAGPISLIPRFIGQQVGIKQLLLQNRIALTVRLVVPFIALLLITDISLAIAEGVKLVHSLTEALKFSTGLYILGWLTSILSIQTLRKYRALQDAASFSQFARRLSTISVFAAGAIVAFSIFVSLFCASLFESVPSILGGPTSEFVQLHVRKESVPDLKGLGVEFSANNSQLTVPLPLVYESNEEVYVAVFGGNSQPDPTQESVILTPGQPIPPTIVKVQNQVLRIDKKLFSISKLSPPESLQYEGWHPF